MIYDVDNLLFLSPFPDFLSIKCPVCLELLLEGHLVSCCGQHFCQDCIRKVRVCPTCKAEQFDVMSDKSHQRAIKSLQVHCVRKDKGCDWNGGLVNLDIHMKNECQYRLVECSNQCGSTIVYHQLEHHQLVICPKRKYKCPYCSRVSTYDDITEKHINLCPLTPVKCQNGCHKTIKRNEQEQHTQLDCPLQGVACHFKVVGCKHKPQRQDLEQHINNDCPMHLSLVMKTVKQQEKLIHDLVQNVYVLQEENKQIKALLIDHGDNKSSDNVSINTDTTHKVDQKECQGLKVNEASYKQKPKLPRPISVVHCRQSLTNFNRRKLENSAFTLSSFNVGVTEHRMALYIVPNGRGKGLGTHVSVFARLVRISDCCARQLQWPFRGYVKIRLVNQSNDFNHIVATIHYDDNTPDSCALNPVDCQFSHPYGIERFIPHKLLQTYNAQYLKQDRIIFEVVEASVSL